MKTMPVPLVRVDSSDVSHVVHCSVCRASWVYLSKTLADIEAQAHRLIERERALPSCTELGCSEYGVARGLCRRHYDRVRYQPRKASR